MEPFIGMEIEFRARMTRCFPDGFLWGAATSSHQVEGDNHHNDWWTWEQTHSDRIRGKEGSGSAAQWWAGRAESDLQMAAEMGHNAHRMSLEWSRIEPEIGRIDHKAVDRYRAILGAARDAGLHMFLNLHHFTLPRWVAERGGWSRSSIVPRFAEYATRCVGLFNDLTTHFLTVNEPAVLSFKSHLQGMWPPGHRDPWRAARSLAHQIRGHCAAFEAMKRVAPDRQVGIALNIPTIEPARAMSRSDWSAATVEDWLVNASVLRALRSGRRFPPLGLGLRQHRRTALDFIGLNYYGAYRVQLERGRSPRFVQQPTIATETADWGKPSPDGFKFTLLRLAELEVPILVSENGVFDATDEVRPTYIVEHVQAMHEAMQQGAPVFGYLHWSLIDNFEWAQGWTAPFGLVHLDRATQVRTPKKSAHVYAEIARNNRLGPQASSSAPPRVQTG